MEKESEKESEKEREREKERVRERERKRERSALKHGKMTCAVWKLITEIQVPTK